MRAASAPCGSTPTAVQRRWAAWLQVARLQFYPLSLLILGAFAWVASIVRVQSIQWAPLLLTGLCCILVEFITVLTNELHDQETDRHNPHAGPFNGGSRVLPRGLLVESDLRHARWIAAALLLLVSFALWPRLLPDLHLEAVVVGLVGLFLGLGYSAPPIRLSARGWGEAAVAVAHGFVAGLAGYLSQGGRWFDPAPWALALPIAWAILPSIALSGLPDLEADAAAGKRTFAVRFGRRAAVWLALTASLAAFLSLSIQLPASPGAMVFAGLLFVHLLGIGTALLRHLQRGCPAGPQNHLLILTLTYVLWFPAALLLRLPEVLR